MVQRLSVTLLVSSFVLLTACAVHIDSTSEATFSASMVGMSEDMDLEQKAAYDRALTVVREAYGLDRARMAKALDGKDAEDVLDLAADIREKQEKAALAQAEKDQAAHLEASKASLAQYTERCEALETKRLAEDPASRGPSRFEAHVCASANRYERTVANLKEMTPEQYREADKDTISQLKLD
uniref:hypothetical protein n=1 Tax=Pseudomonas laurentiana TaxID=2364649 RepID=UPI0029C8B0BB|nr:hypothetical protein [Pseudomonas laurentiana]